MNQFMRVDQRFNDFHLEVAIFYDHMSFILGAMDEDCIGVQLLQLQRKHLRCLLDKADCRADPPSSESLDLEVQP